MPHLIFTPGALRGLQQCQDFLYDRPRPVRQKAKAIIHEKLMLLKSTLNIGRPLVEKPGLRELIIPFGMGGYIAAYRYDEDSDTVVVLSFRHQRQLE